jgi:RHS repeat-associated protein
MNYNLNRMSASPGVIYTHDMVGNRTAKSVGAVETRYEWDAVNRMTKLGYPNSHHEYVYRSDGMRVRKIKNGGDEVTRNYYDGQMPVEEDFDTSGTANDSVTRNFVGARGLEAMFVTQNSVTNTTYPLYDTHGNMVATLTKNTGGTSWSIGDERSYDVWGSVRSGATTGGPKGRYVANLGHVQDDESGLIYMRARYYEPGTGRFISEDGARDGLNWYTYVSNCPTIYVDAGGGTQSLSWLFTAIGLGCIAVAIYGMTWQKGEFDALNRISKFTPGMSSILAGAALFCFTFAAYIEAGGGRSFRTLEGIGLALTGFTLLATALLEFGKMGSRTAASIAVFAAVAYGFRLIAELALMDYEASLGT